VIRQNQEHAVSVMYDRNIELPEFWTSYSTLVKKYAEPKPYIVVICKSDGTIGEVQKQEVKFIDKCDGLTHSSYVCERPNLAEACKLVLTFNEYMAWKTVDFQPVEFGREFENGVRLPRLTDLEKRFRELANGAERATIQG